jgi:hypothetical protein
MTELWRVDDMTHVVMIGGCFLPWQNGHPVYLQLDGTDDMFIAIFSDAGKLRAMIGDYDNIKQIDDPVEFLGSLPFTLPDGNRLRIMLNPYYTEQGTTRFKEIQRTVTYRDFGQA